MKLPAKQQGWIALTARGSVPKSETHNGFPRVYYRPEHVPVRFFARLVVVTAEFLDAEDAAPLPPVAAKQKGLPPAQAFAEGQKILKERQK